MFTTCHVCARPRASITFGGTFLGNDWLNTQAPKQLLGSLKSLPIGVFASLDASASKAGSPRTPFACSCNGFLLQQGVDGVQ